MKDLDNSAPDTTVLVSKPIIEFARALPPTSGMLETAETYISHIEKKILLATVDELIILEALRILSIQGKIEELAGLFEDEGSLKKKLNDATKPLEAKSKWDKTEKEAFFNSAFQHCIEKNVIEKFLKGKDIEKTLSLIRNNSFLAYIRRTVRSYISGPREKSPNYQKLSPFLPDPDSLEDPARLEEERQLEIIDEILESGLTQQEKRITTIEFSQDRRLTQTEIAHILGVSQQTVSKHLRKRDQRVAKLPAIRRKKFIQP